MRRLDLGLGLCVALASAACRSQHQQPVAELVEAQNLVEESRARAPETWQAAPRRASYFLGDAVRTGKDSSARLMLTGGGEVRLDSETLIRFGAELGVDLGSAEVEAGAVPVRVRTLIGAATIEREGNGGRVRVSAGKDGVGFDVLVGSASIERSGGEKITLERGQGVALAIDGAVIERRGPAPKAPASQPAAPPRTENDAGVAAAPLPDAGAPAPASQPSGVQATIQHAKVTARATDDAPWAELKAGDSALTPGTRVRVDARGALQIAGATARVKIAGPAEIVVGGPDGPILEAVSGHLEVEGTGEVGLPGGRARVVGEGEGGQGDVELVVKKGTPTEVKSKRGGVELGGGKGSEKLVAGESARFGADGTVTVSDRAPTKIDLVITAGESIVIHDPSPPTAVSVRTGERCSGATTLELAKDKTRPHGLTARGEGGAAAFFAAGSHRYVVRCSDRGGGVVGQGTIHIVRDAGLASLPKKAPKSLLDADGRRYTVLYQNLPPELAFRWRKAPGGAMSLKISAGQGSTSDKPRAIAASGDTYNMPSGGLGDGTYEWWFEPDGGGAPSPHTTLRVQFDNAAATASIKEPAVGKGWGEGPVHVSGIAVEGWRVAVGEQELGLDAQHRFEADVTAGKDALSIRLSHPKHGVHFYLRRNGR